MGVRLSVSRRAYWWNELEGPELAMSIQLQDRSAVSPPGTGLPEEGIALIAPRLEERTQAIGRELFARMDRQRGQRGTSARGGVRERVYDAVMQGTMRDEALKTQLFRLVDVLPALRSSEQVARHVREHLLRPEVHLPMPARAVLNASASSRAAAALVAWAARFGSMQ